MAWGTIFLPVRYHQSLPISRNSSRTRNRKACILSEPVRSLCKRQRPLSLEKPELNSTWPNRRAESFTLSHEPGADQRLKRNCCRTPHGGKRPNLCGTVLGLRNGGSIRSSRAHDLPSPSNPPLKLSTLDKVGLNRHDPQP